VTLKCTIGLKGFGEAEKSIALSVVLISLTDVVRLSLSMKGVDQMDVEEAKQRLIHPNMKNPINRPTLILFLIIIIVINILFFYQNSNRHFFKLSVQKSTTALRVGAAENITVIGPTVIKRIIEDNDLDGAV